MKLYSAPLSLFARKVEIALAEKGLAFERIQVPFSQERGYSPKHPEVLAANPKGQVPVLVDGDLTIYDSTVILEYLEDAWPTPPLYPAAPKERARCRQLELLADEVMLVPLRKLMHRTGPRSEDADAWQRLEAEAKQAGAVIDEQLAELDGRLSSGPYLCGAFSVADIAVFMAVLFSQRLGGPPLGRHAKLARWWMSLGERPAFEEVAAAMLAADRALSRPVPGAYRGSEGAAWFTAG